jgi:hypothetical protein
MSGVVAHSFWFACFMSGLHKRVVGEVRKQEKWVTIDNLWELSKIIECAWQKTNILKVKGWVAEMGVWFVAGLCTGLSRGKKNYR